MSRDPLTPTPPPPPVLDDEREKGRLILFERKMFEFKFDKFGCCQVMENQLILLYLLPISLLWESFEYQIYVTIE